MLRSKVTICVLVFLFMVIFSKTVSALFLRALSSPPRLALRLIRQKMRGYIFLYFKGIITIPKYQYNTHNT